MTPKFQDYQTGFGADLGCPKCGDFHLHHDSVEVFERDKEDSDNGVHVRVAEGQAIVDNKITGNPSSRRDGIKVTFWCEICFAKSVLTIAQHKGSTLVEFVVI